MIKNIFYALFLSLFVISISVTSKGVHRKDINAADRKRRDSIDPIIRFLYFPIVVIENFSIKRGS